MPKDDERTNVRHDHDVDYDPVNDPLNLYIAYALADEALPPLDDVPLGEEAASELTAEDREALATLGTPEEYIARIVAANEPAVPSVRQMEFPTIANDAASTQPEGAAPCRATAPTGEFGHLMASLEKFHVDEQVEWSFGYRKSRQLGRGGQGVVYLAEGQDEFAAKKALKILSPAPYRSVPAYYEEMNRMLNVARHVHEHPHDDLLDVEWFGQHDGIYAMLMQLIDGCDLWQLVQPSVYMRLQAHTHEQRWKALTKVVYSTTENGQLGLQPGIAVYIAEKCLRGLHALHELDIVHGDVKPSNIMLDRSGGVKLVDIGSAFETKAPPRCPTWTPRYAATEFLEHGELTYRSDLASLGYVLIELLSGKPVLAGVAADSIRSSDRDRFGDLLEAKKALPDRFVELLPEKVGDSEVLVEMCRRLIEVDPDKRFNSADDVIESPEGSFTFYKQLICGDLAVPNFQETKRWLADVKEAGG